MRAVADDNVRVSEAMVTVQVQDINDNSPTFSQEVVSNEILSLLVGKFFVLPLIRFGLTWTIVSYVSRVSAFLFLFWCRLCVCRV